jgi:hypothetical protein
MKVNFSGHRRNGFCDLKKPSFHVTGVTAFWLKGFVFRDKPMHTGNPMSMLNKGNGDAIQ